MEEKIKKFKNMTNEQLENIIYNPESSEEDVIIASIEKGHKDIKEGKYYGKNHNNQNIHISRDNNININNIQHNKHGKQQNIQ